MLFNDGRALVNSRRLDTQQAGLSGPALASGNPYLSAWLNILDGAGSAPRVEFGIVVDALPGGYMHRVSAGHRSFLWCSPGGTTTGFGKIGARQLTTYPIGTSVYFIRHPQTPTIGTIIAAEPPWMLGSPDQWPADGIWPFIRSGQKAEYAHYWPVWEDARGASLGDVKLGGLDLADFSAGRPMDATAAGEWGMMMETGVGVFADPFQVYLRVDETTGVFGFYADQLLRVAGHNYQFVSSHTEHEEIEDEGELSGTTRTSIYPWESYGVWRHNQVTPGWAAGTVPRYGYPSGQGTFPTDPHTVQSASGYAIREPEAARPLPAARLFEWQGYLGQGGRFQIAAPLQLNWAYPDIPGGVLSAEVEADLSPTNGTPGGRLVLDGAAGKGVAIATFKTGSWNREAETYTPTGGTPGAVAVGMWISLYDALSSNAQSGCMLPITATDGTTFTVDITFEQGRPKPTGDNIAAVVWETTSPYIVPVNERGPQDLPKSQPGVLNEQRTLAGKYLMQAAGGIILSKRSSQPTPRPNKKAADPAGDKPSNYDASGIASDGEITHKVTAYLAASGGVAHRLAMLPDILAYAFNWEGLHPFAYHEKDWVVEEEGEAGSELVNQKAPDYSTLEVEEYLAAPPPTYLDIDHRYGLVPIYESESTFAMLEDGCIIISDGWGSEIRMGGGHMEFHCAGDIRIFNGRNLLVWAGHDIDLKAQDSLDLTAERADIRTMAGRNSQHMAGNRGCGGFLFETRAVCPSYAFCENLGEDVTGSGFVVLAPNSQVWLLGQDVVAQLEPTHADGRIVLDAGVGREIHTRSKRLINRMPEGGAVVHLFGTDYAANEFGGEYTIIGGKLYVTNTVYASTSSAYAEAATRIDYVSTTYAEDFDETVFTPPGSECAEYSCRTAEQYLSESFTYWQSKWKAIAAGDEQDLPVWDEEAVVGLRSGEITRVHPGERWVEDDGEKQHEFLLTQPDENWTSVSRTDNRGDYEVPVFSDPVEFVLRDEYRLPFLHTMSPPSPPPPPPPPPGTGCCLEALESETTVQLTIPDGPYADDSPYTLTGADYAWTGTLGGPGGSLVARCTQTEEYPGGVLQLFFEPTDEPACYTVRYEEECDPYVATFNGGCFLSVRDLVLEIP